MAQKEDLLTTDDNDNSMKPATFETINTENDETIEDKNDKTEEKNIDENESNSNKNNKSENKIIKPRRSIRNECPRIKGLQSKGNFFNKALHYKIHLPSLKIDIFRRYSDFEWLHKKLLDRYGSTQGLFVPALPTSISLKNINKQEISEHCKLLQEWICDVFKHSNLWNDESTVYFLSQHQNQNFAKMRKSFIDQSDIDKIRKENGNPKLQTNRSKEKSKPNNLIRLKSQDSNNHLQPM